MAEPAPKPGGGNIFTRKIAGLPGWQWAAIIGVGIAAVYYIKNRSGSNTSSTVTPTDTTGTPTDIGPLPAAAPSGGTNGTGDNTALQAAVDSLGNISTSQGAQLKTVEAQNQRQGSRLTRLEQEQEATAKKLGPAKNPAPTRPAGSKTARPAVKARPVVKPKKRTKVKA